MSNQGLWAVKASAFLFLFVMLSSSAEVVDGGIHSTGLGSDGRSFSYGVNGSNNLSNVLSACNVGRAGAGGIGSYGGGGVAPGAQGGLAADGGLIQASIPPGAVIPPAAGTSSSTSANGGQLFAIKCMNCHATNGISITAAKALNKLNNGTMPKPPTTITGEEKAQLLAFVQSGAVP